MVDDFVWDRILSPELEHCKVHKKTRNTCAENIENFQETASKTTFKIKQKLRNEFHFKKHVNASSMILSCEEMTKMRSICTKHEIIFSRSSEDMGFVDQTYHRKFKNGCFAIQSYIRQHEL